MKRLVLLLALVLPGAGLTAQDASPLRVAIVKQPYTGARNVPLRSDNPDYLEGGGLVARLQAQGAVLEPVVEVDLTPAEKRQYGEWNKLGLANGHLAEVVSANERERYITVGLLGNCNALIGMLGGLQHARPDGRLRKVGLIFIDAHGDFNTPETTLSGMLGGMPVAVSTGLALQRLRRKSGLDPAIPTSHIVLGAARDLDPLEAELLEEHDIARLSVDDFRQRSPKLHDTMRRLSDEMDVIYVHIDMDVLDPDEVPGHPLTVPDGPTSAELAAALTEMFRYEKVAALGLASTPANERDPEGVSRQAAYNLIDGALEGVRRRDATDR